MNQPQQPDTTEGDLSEGRMADRKGPNAGVAATKATPSGDRKRAESEARPNSNPKNPGDFGHR